MPPPYHFDPQKRISHKTAITWLLVSSFAPEQATFPCVFGLLSTRDAFHDIEYILETRHEPDLVDMLLAIANIKSTEGAETKIMQYILNPRIACNESIGIKGHVSYLHPRPYVGCEGTEHLCCRIQYAIDSYNGW